MNNTESHETILFVTGRLAEKSLRKVVDSLQPDCKFKATIEVLPISVAALMTPEWIAKRVALSPEIDRIILPGFCAGDLTVFNELTDAKVEIGPKDLRFLPEHFGQQRLAASLDNYDIEIIAEINHAPKMTLEEILAMANSFALAGADVIDIGCDVDHVWNGVGDCVRAIKDLGLRVSIDSLKTAEIKIATTAGAELVLSVNSSNIEFAQSFGTEVVLIPDDPQQWQALETNMELLDKLGVKFRVDPIIEPIGLGFAKSLNRFFQVRHRWPQVPMMMGIGNLTEMTEVDSAGVNLLLLAICQELEIHSVLTTEVINWATTSVKECDIGRRLVRAAIDEQTPPKHIDSRLVTLRDPKVVDLGQDAISEMANQIKDHNFRIFADSGELHVLGGGLHFHGTDPFEILDSLIQAIPKPLSASHAFYLGAELNKAALALQLGKQYTQDEALNFGYLTKAEKNRHRISHRRNRSK